MTARRGRRKKTPGVCAVRCAIYTRKSTSEGLDSDFNTLDAQREACLAYIQSQVEQGWTPVEERYEDGGYTGANTDRPGFQKLLADIKAGKVERVVVYKVDRLSRSLLDFSRIIETFDQAGVGLVAVTQQFDTSTPMGRLTLNILLSFAQFERELISERTRDKVRAARLRGKWTGGYVPLGFKLNPEGKGIVVEPEEAKTVREIYRIYLEERSLRQAARVLNEKGLFPKVRKGRDRRVEWKPQALGMLMQNPIYVGRIRAGEEIVEAEHDAIVDEQTYDQAVALLATQRAPRSYDNPSPDYLLRGLVRCAGCNSPMYGTHTRKGEAKIHRYYRILPHHECPERETCGNRSINAGKLEDIVTGQLKAMASNRATLAALREADEGDRERTTILKQLPEIWEHLWPVERRKVVQSLVEEVLLDQSANRCELRLLGSE